MQNELLALWGSSFIKNKNESTKKFTASIGGFIDILLDTDEHLETEGLFLRYVVDNFKNKNLISYIYRNLEKLREYLVDTEEYEKIIELLDYYKSIDLRLRESFRASKVKDVETLRKALKEMCEED